LAQHVAQAQKDKYRQRQKNDGVNVEHVFHALGGIRTRSTRPGLRAVDPGR
jgi:hypothetical protein